MHNVQADATNKLEAIHNSKDDMAAKVEEMKQLQIDIIKYVEKKRRESGMGSERSPSPGTDTHNPLHKRCATLEQLDRVKRAFSTEYNEVKKETTTMEEELEKVGNKIQRIGRLEEKPKLDDGSDKLHDLRREIEEKIHAVQKDLSKVDQRIEENADTNTEELDELAANVRDNLGRDRNEVAMTLRAREHRHVHPGPLLASNDALAASNTAIPKRIARASPRRQTSHRTKTEKDREHPKRGSRRGRRTSHAAGRAKSSWRTMPRTSGRGRRTPTPPTSRDAGNPSGTDCQVGRSRDAVESRPASRIPKKAVWHIHINRVINPRLAERRRVDIRLDEIGEEMERPRI